MYPEKTNLYDYMPKDTILIMDEPARLLETAKQLERDEAEWNLHLMQNGKSLPDLPLSLDTEELIYQHPYQSLMISIFLRQVPRMQPQNIVNVITRGMQDFHGQMNVLKAEMERWKKSGVQVMMLAGDAERMDRMRRVLQDYGIDEPVMLEGHLQNGFEMPSVHAAIITESEMFSSKQRKHGKPRRIWTTPSASRVIRSSRSAIMWCIKTTASGNIWGSGRSKSTGSIRTTCIFSTLGR